MSPEPEYTTLSDYLGAGDWAIDVGANVGHYTKRLSEIVGPAGRVIAFEPVPETFLLLAGNVSLFRHSNVTLVNAAASDSTNVVGMVIPGSQNGRGNYYQAHISSSGSCTIKALSVTVDSLNIPNPVALVKIDAEGHEGHVILGMEALLTRDRPILILESGAREAANLVTSLGYTLVSLPNSPNVVLLPSIYS